MALLDMPREHWDALEADLMSAGFTLQDYPHRYGLRTLRSFVQHSARSSAVAVEMRGSKSEWHFTEELLARILETLQDANWQRTGNRNAPRPKPVLRPGQEPSPDSTSQHIAGTPMSIAEFEAMMAERTAA